MPNAPYGQFGTSSYPNQTIPLSIVQQYPGALNLRDALKGFGDIAYGPYSHGLSDVAAAQQLDPSAVASQQEVASGGGAYATPGSGTAMLGKLFQDAMGTEATRQQVQSKSVIDALQGMGNVGKTLAQNMYGQQEASNRLDAAEIQSQQEQQQGILKLADIFTNPQGLGANIIGGATGSQTSPFGAIMRGTSGSGGLMSLFGGGAGAAGALSPLDLLGSSEGLGAAGFGAADSSGIFASLAESMPELAAFAF